MKYLPILLGAAAIYGFMNGWGATFGLCPPGFTAAGGECLNNFVNNTPATGVAMPTTVLVAPLQYMWNGTQWVAGYATPVWP